MCFRSKFAMLENLLFKKKNQKSSLRSCLIELNYCSLITIKPEQLQALIFNVVLGTVITATVSITSTVHLMYTRNQPLDRLLEHIKSCTITSTSSLST